MLVVDAAYLYRVAAERSGQTDKHNLWQVGVTQIQKIKRFSHHQTTHAVCHNDYWHD